MVTRVKINILQHIAQLTHEVLATLGANPGNPEVLLAVWDMETKTRTRHEFDILIAVGAFWPKACQAIAKSVMDETAARLVDWRIEANEVGRPETAGGQTVETDLYLRFAP